MVSIAGPAQLRYVKCGIALLEKRGFDVSWEPATVRTKHPYLAASDQVRLASLNDAFDDQTVDAIMCTRGGYGSMRLLADIDAPRLASLAKPFVGYSDVTAIHLALNAAGLVTYHGPVITTFGNAPAAIAEASADGCLSAITGNRPSPETHHGQGRLGGPVSGPLVGGNLSLLAACLPIQKTAISPSCLLLIEEVAEPLYRIDRMITGLKLAGLLDNVAGFVLGSFSQCGEGRGGPKNAEDVVVENLMELGVPIVSGFSIGHRDTDVTVPLGAPATLDGSAGTLTLRWIGASA